MCSSLFSFHSVPSCFFVIPLVETGGVCRFTSPHGVPSGSVKTRFHANVSTRSLVLLKRRVRLAPRKPALWKIVCHDGELARRMSA